MHRQVAWQDIDTMQHVNNAVYMEYINECSFQVCAAYNWPWQRMVEQGFVVFLRQARLQYLQPAVLGDELKIKTWVSSINRASAGRHYTIHRADDSILLAQAYTLGVWIDIHTFQPMRIPHEMLEDFAVNVVPQE
jgi:acyl-CoA thioester hydrolase